MNPQLETVVSILSKKGFTINRTETDCVYMMKRRGPSTFYAEVELYDNRVTVNGETLADFLKRL